MSVQGYLGDQVGHHKTHDLRISTDLNKLGEMQAIGVVCEDCHEIVVVLGGPQANLYDGEMYRGQQIDTCIGGIPHHLILSKYGDSSNPANISVECDVCNNVVAELYDVNID